MAEAARLVPAVFVTLLFSIASAGAQSTIAVDPHALFETRCYSCHTDQPEDFAQLRLMSRTGKLAVAGSGKDLAVLLKNHRGVKLNPVEIAAISQLFRNELAWGGVYQHKCASCHGKAVTFARTNLRMDGDKLVGGANGRDISAFLAIHGDTTPAEVATLLDMLKYQLATQAKK